MPEKISLSDSRSLSVNATSVFLTKDIAAAVGGMASSSGAPALICNVLSDDKWTPKTFSAGKSFLKIGGAAECDLCLPAEPSTAKVHCSPRLVFSSWYILESASERNMKINGVKRPQIILKPGEGCAVRIGFTEILLQSQAAKDTPLAATAPNPDKTVVLKGAADVKYMLDSSSVLGSDKSASLQFPELPPFAGVVFTFANRPFLHSFNLRDGSILVGGEDASETPRELKNGTMLTYGGKKLCSVALPDPLLSSAQGAPINLNFSGNLALQEVSSTRFGSKLILPAAGRSISIGREPDNHFIMESGSISKKHAQLLIYENSVMVLDNKSTNGTFIEEEPVSKKLLHPGEIVRFADKRFLLCHAE